jgi:predicted HTH domain antitoxin
MKLHIPHSVADAITLPEDRKEQVLQQELAATLYRGGILSFGKARELASSDKFAFAQLTSERGIHRHYGPDELEEDLAYARGTDE